jgi:hypothetical protein
VWRDLRARTDLPDDGSKDNGGLLQVEQEDVSATVLRARPKHGIAVLHSVCNRARRSHFHASCLTCSRGQTSLSLSPSLSACGM